MIIILKKTPFILPGLIFILLIVSITLGYAQSFTKIDTGVVVNDGGVSGGISWIDFDNDDDLDLFITNAQNHLNFLYRNEGEGNFVRVDTGLIATDINRSAGNSWGDYDNDGDPDLFVSNQEQKDILYTNIGNGYFRKITNGAIVNNSGDSHHCSWGDYNNDGYLDLFVSNGGFINTQKNFLYLNNAPDSSGFTQIFNGDIVNDSFQTFGGNWADYDNDGDIDLFVANFTGNNMLYRNNGNKSFTKMTSLDVGNIVTDGRSSIGSSWGDYNNDGYLDLFVANWNNQNNALYRNNGDGSFSQIDTGRIVTDGGVSWVGIWGDYDNDGDIDIFVTNYNQNNFMYLNDGDGTFTKVTNNVIVNDGGLSSGTSCADYDNDGDLDIVVANWENQNNYMYENRGNSNHWINIKCVGTVSNFSAIGAKVRLKTTISGNQIWQKREIFANTGLRSQNSLNVEFGLRDAAIIDSIIVKWPSGIIENYTNINVNQFITIKENFGIVKINDININLPLKAQLFQNYPNPFNPSTNITYWLSKSSHVQLMVHDVLGRQVKNLINEFQSSGSKSIKWDGTNDHNIFVSSGIYFYKIKAGKFQELRKMILIR